MDRCAKCGESRDGCAVRMYYGTMTGETAQSFGDPSGNGPSSIVTTKRYRVDGWDDVGICDACTRKHSWASGIVKALWSIPLALFFIAGVVVWFTGGLPRDEHNTVLTYYMSIFIFGVIGLSATVAAGGAIRRIFRPLNDESRSELARKVTVARYARVHDAVWTQAEYDALEKPT